MTLKRLLKLIKEILKKLNKTCMKRKVMKMRHRNMKSCIKKRLKLMNLWKSSKKKKLLMKDRLTNINKQLRLY